MIVFTEKLDEKSPRNEEKFRREISSFFMFLRKIVSLPVSFLTQKREFHFLFTLTVHK